jgi:hypothetical protein
MVDKKRDLFACLWLDGRAFLRNRRILLEKRVEVLVQFLLNFYEESIASSAV